MSEHKKEYTKETQFMLSRLNEKHLPLEEQKDSVRDVMVVEYESYGSINTSVLTVYKNEKAVSQYEGNEADQLYHKLNCEPKLKEIENQ